MLSQKSHKISYPRLKLFKIKGRNKQFFTTISVSMGPMTLILIIIIVEHEICNKFYFKHFFMRLTVFGTKRDERAVLIHAYSYCNARSPVSPGEKYLVKRLYMTKVSIYMNHSNYSLINTSY